MTKRVVIADDHALLRAGLRKLLESTGDVTVVGEAEDGESAVAIAVAVNPDILLLDLSMPRGGGMGALEQLHKQLPHVRVLILSMHLEAAYVRQTLKLGASGYLVKDSAPAELEIAIRAIGRGETYLSPAIAGSVLGDYVERLRSDDAQANALTPRQSEILVLIARGLSTKDIARQLDLSVKTVDTHRTQLMKQLDIHEVTGLVRYALKHGLISLQD